MKIKVGCWGWLMQTFLFCTSSSESCGEAAVLMLKMLTCLYLLFPPTRNHFNGLGDGFNKKNMTITIE